MTAQDTIGTDNNANGDFIRVTQTASETRTLPYVQDMTVQQALEQAEVVVDPAQVVLVNAEEADLDAVLAPNSIIGVVGKIANG